MAWIFKNVNYVLELFRLTAIITQIQALYIRIIKHAKTVIKFDRILKQIIA